MTQEDIFIMFRNMTEIYDEYCEPVCKEYDIPHISLEILSFLSEYPEHFTAKDISSIKKIKPSLVSLHVEKLVKNGYLVRESVNGDRRKVKLVCTEKAQAVIARGRQKQEEFQAAMFENIDESTREAFFAALGKIENNLDKMMKENG